MCKVSTGVTLDLVLAPAHIREDPIRFRYHGCRGSRHVLRYLPGITFTKTDADTKYLYRNHSLPIAVCSNYSMSF